MSKVIKKAISVYDPSDPWEQAIQDASKTVTGEWLPSYPCQLLAKAVALLQSNNELLDEEELMPARAFYLFNPLFTNNKESMVFVTHLLFLRDILENNEINIQLHEPVTFMTRSLAHFLFRHCPVHIYLNADLLKAANRKAEFVNVGGFIIAPKDNISVDDAIEDVVYYGDKNKIDQFLDIKYESLKKAAGKLVTDEFGEETIYSSEHYRAIRPDDRVWNKNKRIEGVIEKIEPNTNGNVHIRYLDGDTEILSKEDFDIYFVIMPKETSNAV